MRKIENSNSNLGTKKRRELKTMSSTQRLFMFKTSLNTLFDEGFSSHFVYREMVEFGKLFLGFVYWALFKVGIFFWVSVQNLFEAIIRHLTGSRVVAVDDSKNRLDFSGFSEGEEEEKSEFFFGFRFQNINEGFVEETGDSFVLEQKVSDSSQTSKYQFVTVKEFGGYIQEPKTVSFTVHELFMGSDDNYIRSSQNLDYSDINPGYELKKSQFEDGVEELKKGSEKLSPSDLQILNVSDSSEDLAYVVEGKTEDLLVPTVKEKEEDLASVVVGKTEDSVSILEGKTEDSVSVNEGKTEDSVSVNEGKTEDSVFVNDGKTGDSVSVNEGKTEDSVSVNDGKTGDSVSVNERKTEDSALGGKEDLNLGKNEGSKNKQVNWLGEYFSKMESFSYGVQSMEDNEFTPSVHEQTEPDSSSFGFSTISGIVDLGSSEFSSDDIDEDYIEFEPHLDKLEENVLESDGEVGSRSHSENSSELVHGSLESVEYSRFEVVNDEVRNEVRNVHIEERETMRSWDSGWDSDEEDDDSDCVGEHQELIDQMKMELKMARTGGLPTILEECETPRILEDLKPLKMDEKYEHGDRMAEIHKFYKSYAEKMRKLDVLNYQTLKAIGLLRMKHPDELNSGETLSFSAIKTVVFPHLWPCKLRRIYADPTLKSISELNRDLEVVYVGQTCLSWEILRWQYGKAQELQQHDPHGYRSYNQVAIEFQQFQVLLQRFTEDQPFQEPRVQHYVNKRCTLRGLLQVPAIKDDSMKDKKARRAKDGDAVSVSMLGEMIKESMKVFWVFLRTDKDFTNLILTKVLQGNRAHLQSPSDSELLMDIKSSLQKKERRLKDIVKTGNCLVKKFQKQEEDKVRLWDHQLFIAQVELRLVSRVLNLPILSRDQLIWCQTKLNNINFVGKEIHVEAFFLLFPC